MSLVTGVDIVDIDRFAQAVERRGRRLLERLFTDPELSRGLSIQSLAARFAAKEAFLKALGTGLSGGVSWRDIEIAGGESTRPEIGASGEAAVLLGRGRVSLSLSHTGSLAVAFVVIDDRED
jgi:holo-[acyl-carrier protein] synthase